MRSPTDRLERGLRLVALAALAAAAWTTGGAPRDRVVTVPADTVRFTLPASAPAAGAGAVSPAAAAAALAASPAASGLAARLVEPGRPPVHLLLHDVPALEVRALLQAAREADLAPGWAVAPGAAVPALAVSAAASADPRGGTLVRATADRGQWLVLRDSLGWLDSARLEAGSIRWALAGDVPAPCVEQAGTRACAPVAPAGRRSRVRLYATPGWEAQFTMRALEEVGYTVDARFAIAPRVGVRAGGPEPLDTGRHVAAVALDSAAWPDAASLARFVRDGGGLVVAGAAAFGAPRGFPLAGTAGGARPAVPGALSGATPRDGLVLHPVGALGAEVVVFERSDRPDRPVALAARRLGAGRVVQAGWRDLWEWRLLGDDGSVAAHREWWATQVARATGARFAGPEPPSWFAGDAAPLADLVARLGPAAPAVPGTIRRAAPALPWPGWLALASAALVAEWWLRRTRGRR
jgi:hypothetical protein